MKSSGCLRPSHVLKLAVLHNASNGQSVWAKLMYGWVPKCQNPCALFECTWSTRLGFLSMLSWTHAVGVKQGNALDLQTRAGLYARWFLSLWHLPTALLTQCPLWDLPPVKLVNWPVGVIKSFSLLSSCTAHITTPTPQLLFFSFSVLALLPFDYFVNTEQTVKEYIEQMMLIIKWAETNHVCGIWLNLLSTNLCVFRSKVQSVW